MKTTEERVFDLLEKTNTNWTVNKNQLFDGNSNPTQSFGIFKQDKHWLGTVGDKYIPLQNWELATILMEATKEVEVEFDRGGFLSDGKKVYFQAALPDMYIGKSNVKRLITGLNSHDGSTSVGFGSTNTVVVCQNTFYRAYGEIQKFRHTASMKARIEIAKNDLIRTLNLDNNLMNSFQKMAATPMKDEAIESVIRKIFGVEASLAQSEISTRKKNQIEKFADSLNTSITEQGRTIWALFNGVTRFTNHVLSEDNNLEYLMIGGGNRISNIGYEELMKFVEDNTVSAALVN